MGMYRVPVNAAINLPVVTCTLAEAVNGKRNADVNRIAARSVGLVKRCSIKMFE